MHIHDMMMVLILCRRKERCGCTRSLSIRDAVTSALGLVGVGILRLSVSSRRDCKADMAELKEGLSD